MVAQKRSLQEAMTILEEIVGRIRQTRRPPDWSRYALIYDLSVGELLTYQALIEGVVLAARIEPGMMVVDAATGTGNLIAQVMSVQPDVTVHGFENEPSMLEMARNKFDFELFGNIHLHQVDLNGSGWVDAVGEGQADVVCSVNTLYILESPEVFVRDVRRVLRPGGRFVLSNPVTEKVEPAFLKHLQQGGKITDEMVEMVEINYDIIDLFHDRIFHRLSSEQLIVLGDAHGFRAADWRPDYAGVNATVEFVAV